MGDPGKPAISPFPLLGLLSVATRSLVLGTLVARIGLVTDDVLVGEFRTLSALSGKRVIAALGTGDRQSAEENLAYGVGFPSSAERRAALGAAAAALSAENMEVWIGAGGERTNAIARELGVTLNLYDAALSAVDTEARFGKVSWAGALPRERASAAVLLRSLESAGATWAVVASTNPVQEIAAAARSAGIALAA